MTPTKLQTEFTAAKKNMQQTRDLWDMLLTIAYAKLSTEKGFKSRVREGSLSSLLWERSARVVAQLPTGRVRSLSKNDQGKSMLMDLAWHKYVIPNANTDYSFKIKLRMWDYYSLVYGAMPAQYDYRIDDEYVGPDFRLVDPRFCYPKVGRTSLHSCEGVFIVTYHSREYLKSRIGLGDWKDGNIAEVLDKMKDGEQPSGVQETTTPHQTDRGEAADLHKDEVMLVTYYERGKKGRWITFAPDYGYVVLRDIKNPHESGRIPIVFKYAMPLIDSIWGMGDVERGASLQKAIDTVVNLNLDFTKFKIFPPMWYRDGAVPQQMRYEPGAKWKTTNGQADFGFVNPGANSTNESQAVYQFLKGALLNQNGTTDTTISTSDGLPGFGKTPEALQKLEKRENARDQWDRDMFEEAYQDLANGMINLMGTKQPVPIDFHIFDDDVYDIYKAGFTDIMEIYESAKDYRIEENDAGDGEMKWTINKRGTAKITINQERLGGKWLYQVDAGTTTANDQQEEFDRVLAISNFLASPAGQWLVQGSMEEGRKISRTELLDQIFTASGIKNKDKIFDPFAQDSSQNQGGNGTQPKQFDLSMLNNQDLAARLAGSEQSQPDMQQQATEQPNPAMEAIA